MKTTRFFKTKDDFRRGGKSGCRAVGFKDGWLRGVSTSVKSSSGGEGGGAAESNPQVLGNFRNRHNGMCFRRHLKTLNAWFSDDQ